MAQILVRQVDDGALDRLKARAREGKTSVEALVREAIHKAAEMTVDEKLARIRKSQQWSREARIAGSKQSFGTDLIREDRDHDH